MSAPRRRGLAVRAIAVVAAVVGSAATVLPRQQVPRDPTGVSADSASIAGVVVSDDRDMRPLYRAFVTLTGSSLAEPRAAITSGDGTFRFDRLPPGRYAVSAAKDGYLPTGTRPTTGMAMASLVVTDVRAPLAVTLERGACVDTTVRLMRGGVITGTILDADGQPAPGTTVAAIVERWTADTGTRRFVSIGPVSGRADTSGTYRLYGLPPGAYLVLATPSALAAREPVQVISDAEERRALAETAAAQQRPAPEAQNGTAGLARTARSRSISYTPMYYPGVTTPARATPITLGPGEERTGADIQLQYLPTTTVRVTPSVAAGNGATVVLSGPAAAGAAATVRNMTPDGEGRFVLDGVRSGEYIVGIRLPAAPGDSATGSSSWATEPVQVNGEEIVDVIVTTGLALTIAGRVALERSTPATGPPPGPRLTLSTLHVHALPGLTTGGLPPIELDGAGRFSISGIVPGAYRISSEIPGSRSTIAGWWLKSLVVAGRDVLDAPLAFERGTADGVLTFSDRSTELDGWVRDSGGAPVLDRTVVIFATAREAWFLNSRRIAGLRVGPDGHYAIRNLPAGDYWIAAASGLEQGEWFDPERLERLASRALAIRLGEHEKKTQDLVVTDR